MIKETRFIFFGSSDFSVSVLDSLETNNLSPVTVVTLPDKPKGRKLILTPNPVKIWANERNIKVLEVDSFKDSLVLNELKSIKADVFLVASFGKILPKEVIYLPPFKTLNIHPSLLPKLRGPAPIQGAILNEETTGVTIMRIDEKMDHGPILKQETVTFDKWPEKYSVVENALASAGAKLFVEILPLWLENKIQENPQNESEVTFTHMIKKEDGNISNDSPQTALRKIMAYEVWPRAFTFYKRPNGKTERLVITSAHLEDNKLIFDKVIPEGKREMSWKEFSLGNQLS